MPNSFDDLANATGEIIDTIDSELSQLVINWTKRIIASIKAASKAFSAALSGAVLYDLNEISGQEVLNDLRLAGLAAAVAAIAALGARTAKDRTTSRNEK